MGTNGKRLILAVTLIVCLLVVTPILTVVSSLFMPLGEHWQHLLEYQLIDLVVNTFMMLTGVLTGTLAIALPLAWLNAFHDYPGRRVFIWAHALPLAFPSYIIGFIVAGLIEVNGPIQRVCRMLGGMNMPLHQVPSVVWVILVMSVCLYPYVYLMAFSAFCTQGRRSMEAARVLGDSPIHAFFRIVVPSSRPWIAAGCMLVAMETLADFGTVSIFNYDVFTTAIYKAWFGFFSLQTALQLASFLLVLALVTMALEQFARKGKRFTGAGRSMEDHSLRTLKGLWSVAAYCFASTIVAGTCLLPLIQLLVWSIGAFHADSIGQYLGLLTNSVVLASVSASVVLLASIVLAYGGRWDRSGAVPWLTRLATMGYALPGTVLAAGFVMPFAWGENLLADVVSEFFGVDPGLVFSGSVLAMVLAYLVRFLAPAHQSVSTGLERISPLIDDASMSLHPSTWRLIRLIHLPLIRRSLIVAFLIVFVDLMKEMPITLMTRPFGWDTLAVKVYEFTSEGEWQKAALPSAILVSVGFISVLVLSYSSGVCRVNSARGEIL